MDKLGRKAKAERRRIATEMKRHGTLHKAILEELISHNFSDEAIDRMVERGWLKDYQARTIRSAK